MCEFGAVPAGICGRPVGDGSLGVLEKRRLYTSKRPFLYRWRKITPNLYHEPRNSARAYVEDWASHLPVYYHNITDLHTLSFVLNFSRFRSHSRACTDTGNLRHQAEFRTRRSNWYIQMPCTDQREVFEIRPGRAVSCGCTRHDRQTGTTSPPASSAG